MSYQHFIKMLMSGNPTYIMIPCRSMINKSWNLSVIIKHQFVIIRASNSSYSFDLTKVSGDLT